VTEESDSRPPVALEQRGVSADQRMFSPSAARNLAPILAVLKRVLPTHGVVLEIGCGTGEKPSGVGPRPRSLLQRSPTTVASRRDRLAPDRRRSHNASTSLPGVATASSTAL
jgi:Protein of unknown function (DUF938)